MKGYLYEVWQTNTAIIREFLILSNTIEESEDKLCSEINDNDEYKLINEIETIL